MMEAPSQKSSEVEETEEESELQIVRGEVNINLNLPPKFYEISDVVQNWTDKG